MIEQSAGVARQPSDREIDEPLSQRFGEFSFHESQQTAHLGKCPVARTEKPNLLLGFSATPHRAQEWQDGAMFDKAAKEVNRPFSPKAPPALKALLQRFSPHLTFRPALSPTGDIAPCHLKYSHLHT
ncbi:hypothetical protein [Pseudomonas alloputida]|uniref:hypothetical protein n=1 Tax=Pseudomonas TaxID=286 RepID=UPI003EEEFF6E